MNGKFQPHQQINNIGLLAFADDINFVLNSTRSLRLDVFYMTNKCQSMTPEQKSLVFTMMVI